MCMKDGKPTAPTGYPFCFRPPPPYRELVFEMRVTKVLSASRNIRVAQEFAGHSQITTTEIYTHVLPEEMDKAVKEAF